MADKPRVVVIDDDYFVRQALTALLTKDPRTEILTTAATPEEALEWLRRKGTSTRIDVILLDVQFAHAELSGLEAIPLLRQQVPQAAILLFSMIRDDQVILKAIRAGANGFLWKNEAAAGIASAILRVYEGRFVVTKSIAQRLFGKISDLIGHRPAEIFPEGKTYEELTNRMAQVIRLFCLDGLSAPEIAEELHISENTVRGHIKAAYEVLGAVNRREAFLKLIAREDEGR